MVSANAVDGGGGAEVEVGIAGDSDGALLGGDGRWARVPEPQAAQPKTAAATRPKVRLPKLMDQVCPTRSPTGGSPTAMGSELVVSGTGHSGCA